MVHSVLIVHADPAESRRLADIVSRLGLNAAIAGKPANGAGDAPAVAILDLDQPEFNGLDALRQIKDELRVPVIALAASGGRSLADAALAAGASDVIVPPATPERIGIAVRNALKISALEEQIGRVQRLRNGCPRFADMIAVSPEMQRALTLASRAADLDLPVLLEGEPGTGKEVVAKAIRAASGVAGGPFIVKRCGGRNGGLENGADADDGEAIDAAWAAADKGILFIGEIAELSSSGQVALAERLTGQAPDRLQGAVGTRLICSSSKNLIERVKTGQFREELYYRINVFPIWLPPLRDRIEDIPALSRHFLSQIIAEEGRSIEVIDDEAMALLKAYVWPGNVRQLENAIFRAVALADGDRLTVQEFPQVAAQLPGFQPGTPAVPAIPLPPRFEGPAMVGGNLPATRPITFTPVPNSPVLGIPAVTESGEIRRLEAVEADLIRLALGHYRGHITEVARRLGIGRSTLYRKMREFGLTSRHN